MCRDSPSRGPTGRNRFSCRYYPARYNSSRTDGRFDPGVLKNTPNRLGRQITGDRMSVPEWFPVFALTMSKEERLFLWVSVLAGVLLIAAVFLARLDRWRKRQMEDRDESPAQLGSFREMYERGEISKGEYDRVLKRIADRARAKTVAKPVVTAGPEPTPAPPETEEPPAPPPG